MEANKKKATALPLYKRLNEERTQGEGEWKSKTMNEEWEEVQTDSFNLAGSTIMVINHENKDGKANAQYTALAVNNLHKFGGLIEWIIKEIEETPDELNDALLGLIKIKCRQILASIS